MKKVLMVICVLSLLGMLAVPVLAQVLTEGGPSNEVARLPGYLQQSLAEEPGEEPVQIARITIRPPAPRS